MRKTENPNRSQVQRINRLLAYDGNVLRRLRPDTQGFAPYVVTTLASGDLVRWAVTDLDALEDELRDQLAAAS